MAANVKSLDAIRQFRGDLGDYREALRQALDVMTAELCRVVDYFESDRVSYWPAQVRQASEEVASARGHLERCQVSQGQGDGPSCQEEKKALQRAKQRLFLAQQKVKDSRMWARRVRKEVDEFQTRLAPLRFTLDSELPRALTLLTRLSTRLERYVESTAAKDSASMSRRADRPSEGGDACAPTS